MKLSEVRPCDHCHQPLAPDGNFYTVDISQAMLNRQAYIETASLANIFGGNLAIAEAMSPQPEVILVFMDEQRDLRTRVLLCNTCAQGEKLDLGSAMQTAIDHRLKIAEKSSSEDVTPSPEPDIISL